MTDLSQMDRRTLIERAAWLLGAAAVPGEALARVAPRAGRGTRNFLTPAHMTLLSAVADTIIPQTDTPGALGAHVPAKFDALLVNWASPQRKVELVGALTKINDAALAQQKKGFAALTPEQRKACTPDVYRLCAGENIAQRTEVIGMRGAGVAVEEGVGAEQDGGAGLVDQFRHDPVMQRAGVKEHFHPVEQGQQGAAGQPETVEHGQRVEHDIARVEIDPGGELGAIGEQIAVCENNALGRAFRSAGEQDY